MSTPANVRQNYRPNLQGIVPPEADQAIRHAYDAIREHDIAIEKVFTELQTVKAAASTATTTTTSSGTTSTTPVYVPTIPYLGDVNDQTGQTSYATQSTDNGSLVAFSDASAVAVSLNYSVQAPWFIFAANYGAGAVTFTPSSGTINGGGTFVLPQYELSIIFFDGTNWWATPFANLVSPVSFPQQSHIFLNSFDATTGIFTGSHPDYSDLTNPPQLPVSKPAVGGNFLTSYDATTGLFGQAAGGGGGGALTLITEILLSGTATNFDFTSIPGTYRDLIVKCDARGDNGTGNINALITFNADTGGNYDYDFSQSNSGIVSGYGASNVPLNQIPAASATANYTGGFEFVLLNYKGTTFYKRGQFQSSLLISPSTGNTYITYGSFWWRNAAAITRITVTASAGNFIAGSICSLYGRS